MENSLQNIKINVLNSKLNIEKNKRDFLTYSKKELVPCCTKELEDSIDFIFDIEDLIESRSILNYSFLEKLKFLINCAELEHMDEEYDFSLSLDNLMIDINLIPKVLLRDVKSNNISINQNNKDFLHKYKALAGSVLLKKYNYENYLYGGLGLYKKDSFLFKISEFETLDEIKNLLLGEYYKILEDNRNNKKMVPKKNVLLSRIAISAISLALIISLLLGCYLFFIDIPFKNSVMNAGIAYINRDYFLVQSELNRFNMDLLSNDVKLFLSRAYVSTENLTYAQIDNILANLTSLTPAIVFDYWISLGRLYFDNAIDIAQRLGDNELLLLAYLKYQAYVQNDINIPGAQRTALLNYLGNNIERLTREREINEAAEAAEGA